MKILVLTGIGETKKRDELLKIKAKFENDNISTIDLSYQKIADINLAISSQSLFSSNKRLVVLENAPDNLDLGCLSEGGTDTYLLILASNPQSTSKLLTSAKKIGAKIMLFEENKELTAFNYLDNLIERKQTAYLELEKLLSEYGGMYILSMVYYLLRRNFLPLPKSAFVQNKIKKQKAPFSEEDFASFYKIALNCEFNIKNGNLPEKVALVKMTEDFICRSRKPCGY